MNKNLPKYKTPPPPKSDIKTTRVVYEFGESSLLSKLKNVIKKWL